MEGGIRWIAAKLVSLSDRIDRAPVFKRGTVSGVAFSGGVYSFVVTIDVGAIKVNHSLGWYHTTVPANGDVVDIVKLGTGEWLCLGTRDGL